MRAGGWEGTHDGGLAIQLREAQKGSSRVMEHMQECCVTRWKKQVSEDITR